MEDNKDTVKVEETKVEETTEKTYTQNEINNSYKMGYSKAKKELEKSEEYKNFIEWKKSNQNDSEKLTELENSNALKDIEINELKALLKIKDSDVKKEFQKFVSNEVMELVDEDTDFDTALRKFKDENPQYFGEVVVKKVQTSPTLVGGTKPKTTNDIMNNIIRSVRN